MDAVINTEKQENPSKEKEGNPTQAPIIKKFIIEEGHGGHHGGAWKIALADMMTAMMAFFLLMWLLGATQEDKRKSVAEYLRPTSHSQVTMGKLSGSEGILGGTSIIDVDGFKYKMRQTALLEKVTPRSEAGPDVKDGSSDSPRNKEGELERKGLPPNEDNKKKESKNIIEKEIIDKLRESELARKIADSHVNISLDPIGIRVDLIDRSEFSMFELGTAIPNEQTRLLISKVSEALADKSNPITIRGHTDSVPYLGGAVKNNWTLSSDRADAIRQVMLSNGVLESRFRKIEGVADTEPFITENRLDPRNRRISIYIYEK
jgi:chemotaxis protein MotB